jgi:hypothetical protein
MKQRPKFLAGVDLKKLRKYLIESRGDGWRIWSPEKFTDMGFDLRELPVEKHESGVGKWELTTPEGTHEAVTGVWNLAFLQRLAAQCEVEYTSYMGRGFQARSIRDAVRPAIDKLIGTENGNNRKET